MLIELSGNVRTVGCIISSSLGIDACIDHCDSTTKRQGKFILHWIMKRKFPDSFSAQYSLHLSQFSNKFDSKIGLQVVAKQILWWRWKQMRMSRRLAKRGAIALRYTICMERNLESPSKLLKNWSLDIGLFSCSLLHILLACFHQDLEKTKTG